MGQGMYGHKKKLAKSVLIYIFIFHTDVDNPSVGALG